MQAHANAPCQLDYEPATHRYWLRPRPGAAGRWLPSVTRILADCGYVKGSRFFTSGSRQRGTALHRAVHMIGQHAPDATTLDEVRDMIELDDRLLGCIQGWLLFKRETGFVPLRSEFQVWSPTLQVAGTVDACGTYGDGRRVLLDLKSWVAQGAKPKRAAEIQVAGYSILARESVGIVTDLRAVLKLPGDGSYRCYPCTNDRDEQIFRCCCSIWWDRHTGGLIDGQQSDAVVDVEG